MLRKLLFLSISCLIAVSPLAAQASHLGMNPVQKIDGATNPELIPDSTAYRLFFVVVGLGNSPSDQDRIRQATNIAKIRLNDADVKTLTAAVNDFKASYDAAIQTHNSTADTLQKNGQVPDVSAFLAQRDVLVEATRNKLSSSLTADGSSRLNAYIQAEKHGMKIVRAVS